MVPMRASDYVLILNREAKYNGEVESDFLESLKSSFFDPFVNKCKRTENWHAP
jgi:hypothetical protein